MKGIALNIEQETLANEDFRRVLYTAKHTQLVLMSLPPHAEIGMEVHNDNDQFFRFESGKGTVLIDDNEYGVSNGDAVIVPSGSKHNVINISDTEPLKLYTLYSPPHHKDGIVRASREEADAHNAPYDGVTSE